MLFNAFNINQCHLCNSIWFETKWWFLYWFDTLKLILDRNCIYITKFIQNMEKYLNYRTVFKWRHTNLLALHTLNFIPGVMKNYNSVDQPPCVTSFRYNCSLKTFLKMKSSLPRPANSEGEHSLPKIGLWEASIWIRGQEFFAWNIFMHDQHWFFEKSCFKCHLSRTSCS